MTDVIPSAIERPGSVAYDLSTPGHAKITLPPSSTWSSGLHWHEQHDEYLQVLKGSIRVRLGDTVQTITAGQPEVKVERNVWHEWRRAEVHGEDEVIVVERTEPDDGEKALFFYNLNGVILNGSTDVSGFAGIWVPESAKGLMINLWVTLNLYIIFAHLDNVPVFLDAPKLLGFGGAGVSWLDRIISHVILFLASRAGSVLGVRPVQRRFTPADDHDAWWSSRGGAEKKRS